MARTVVPLTDPKCEAAKPRDKDFRLRLVKPAGVKSWWFKYTKPAGASCFGELPGAAVNTKTKKAHTLPLTEQACAFLNRYRVSQATSGYDGAYLFPGAHGQPLSETPAQMFFATLAGDEWTSHDLRKTARTAWADLGVDYLIGELLLNHALKALDVTYIQTTAEAQKRQALERWHAWLDERGFAALYSPAGSCEAKT